MKRGSGYQPSRSLAGLFAILLPLIFAAFACNFQAASGTNDGLIQTNVALGVQQTLLAQTAAAIAAPTTEVAPTASVAVVPQPVDTATSEPTLTALPTEAPPTEAPAQPTASETSAPVALEVIDLTNWKTESIVPLSSGCFVPDQPCWKADPAGSTNNCRGCLGSSPVDYSVHLTSREKILIDDAWPRPYLTFYYQIVFEPTRANLGVEVIDRGTVASVFAFDSSSPTWKQAFVDLSEFKGEEVLIRLGGNGTQTREFSLFLQQIQIVPDFSMP